MARKRRSISSLFRRQQPPQVTVIRQQSPRAPRRSVRERATAFRGARAGFNFKRAAAQWAVATLGGGSSYMFDELSRLTETKVDDSLIFRVSFKGLLGMAGKWLFNNNDLSRSFFDGAAGHAGGSALDKAATKLASKQ